MDELRRIADSLDADPVFAMSLGSKELFHSNLLAWFLEKSRPLREGVADAWGVPPGPSTTGGELWLEREWRQLDLVMHIPGRQVLVVENKVLALPEEDQLDQYAATTLTLPGTPSLVLLSLTDPGWPHSIWNSPSGCLWRYRSYAELTRVLRELAPGVATNDDFTDELLRRWVGLLEKLVEIAEMTGRRMRCQYIAGQIRRLLAADDGQEPVRVNAGFTRSKGLVEGFTYGDYPRFGWQLQGEQFRLAMVVSESSRGYGKTEQSRTKRCAEADRHSAFFDFNHVRAHATNAGPEQPHPGQEPRYRRYDPSFVYRYVRIPQISAGQAIDAGLDSARWARLHREAPPRAGGK